MTIVGLDEGMKLVQLPLTAENMTRFLKLEECTDGQVIDHPFLAGFRVEKFDTGIAFVKDGKYLCALQGLPDLVADRENRGHWEIFAEVTEEKIASLLDRGLYENGEQEAARFSREVSRLLAAGEPVKIYCGAGTVPRPGFLNLDIVAYAPPSFWVSNPNQYFIFPFLDGPWDLPDNSVDYIFHEDLIEHISQLTQIQFLAESLRILKPECWHRVNTPNILTAMKRHSRFKEGFRGVYTGELQHGHVCIFSPLSLKEMAELIGYREVIFTTRDHGVSPYAEKDFRPEADRDALAGNIFADLLK